MTRNNLIPPSPGETEHRSDDDTAPLPEDSEPYRLFSAWFEDARAKEPNDPNGMALATVDEAGLPDVRMVLLKDFSPEGFTFYTNLGSAKGKELTGQPKAALLFHW